MVWYSHLFQNFAQFTVIHTVKGFGIVKKAEIDVFLELSCFFNDQAGVGSLISGSSAFSKTLATVNSAGVLVSFQIIVFSRYMPKSEIAESYGNFIFNF